MGAGISAGGIIATSYPLIDKPWGKISPDNPPHPFLVSIVLSLIAGGVVGILVWKSVKGILEGKNQLNKSEKSTLRAFYQLTQDQQYLFTSNQGNFSLLLQSLSQSEQKAIALQIERWLNKPSNSHIKQEFDDLVANPRKLKYSYKRALKNLPKG